MTNQPYFLEVIQEILETALYTSSIRDAIPISLLLVGESGVAKSKMLMRLAGECIHLTDSFTSQGLFDIVADDKKNLIKFVVTPDLNPTMSRKSSTVQATVANLLSITADGTCRVDDGREQKVAEHSPMGFLTACTPDIYHRQAKKWFALGLRRRIIGIFYTYTKETQNALLALVRQDKINATNFKPFVFAAKEMQASPVISHDQKMTLESHAKDFAVNLGRLSFMQDDIKKWIVVNVMPISPLVTLNTLVRAHALRDGRVEVNEKDMQFIAKFIGFTNPQEPRQL